MATIHAWGISAALILGTLTSCNGQKESISPPPVRPVKIFVVSDNAGATVREFPGKVNASQRAELAFRVVGQLRQVLVKEGDLVKKGQLLARLDPTDFQITVENHQATFDNAQANFNRGKELIGDGYISRLDYDRMEARFRSTSAALSQAKQDLAYTELRAPFPGRLAQRLVENFEEVQTKQPVFILHNVNQLDITIDMPEALIRSFRGYNNNADQLTEQRGREVVAQVVFEGREEKFPIDLKEVATKADENTQTFKATFTMPSPEHFLVLPGMTATVEMDFSKIIDQQIVAWLPVRAVQADSGLSPRVWVLDADTMTVSSRNVSIGRMASGMIEVMSGLHGNEEIVAIGAPYLAEGIKVSRMVQTEQAEPRADESS